jgi:hypothetical protein
MKQKILFIYLMPVMLIGFGFSFPALAQTGTLESSQNTQSEELASKNIIRERIQRQRENYLQNLQEARRVAEERQTRTQQMSDNSTTNTELGFLVRLTNAAEQLANMQNRAEIRIQYYQRQNINVETAQAYLDRSEESLLEMLSHQETLRKIVQNTDKEGGMSVEERNREARILFEQIQNNFKNAQQQLRDSLQTLRDSVLLDSKQETNTENTR